MAQVSQVQLAQPVLSLSWAGLLLGEQITVATILGGLVVILCAGVAVRARGGPTSFTPTRSRQLPTSRG
jgi:drug/metabolite transporter (DMT)-like permease